MRVFISATKFLGATFGVSNIPYPQIGEFVFDDPFRIFYIKIPITVFGIYLSMNIPRSGLGRAFEAVRDATISAATSGVAVGRYKLLMLDEPARALVQPTWTN